MPCTESYEYYPGTAKNDITWFQVEPKYSGLVSRSSFSVVKVSKKMTSESSTGFKEWLNNHTARFVYDKNSTKVYKLCSYLEDPVARFKLLTENKNLVLLTKAAFGNKCQATYFHSVVGVPIKP